MTTPFNTGLNAPAGAKPKLPGVDTQAIFHARLNAWLDLLTELAPEGYSFTIDPPRKGQRNARVVMSINHVGRYTSHTGTSRSVHAFYDLRTGDIYKAAGWKAPAKGVRYNLLDDASFYDLLAHLDWSGRYLYR